MARPKYLDIYSQMIDSCRSKVCNEMSTNGFDNSFISMDIDQLARVAKLRAKLNIPLSVCPCDSKDPNRGCIGSTCLREIIDKGKCLCGCFKRFVLTPKELKAILAKYHFSVEDFITFCEEHGWSPVVGKEKNYYLSRDVLDFLITNKINLECRKGFMEEIFEYMKTDAPMDT